MAGVRRGLRPWGVALALLAVPGGASAAEPEQTVILPGVTRGVATGNLDTDADLELVRLVQEERSPTGPIALEVWDHGSGGWSRVAASEVEVRPAGGAQLPVPAIAALMPWRVGGQQRVLAITGSTEPDNFSAGCCVEIGEVTVRDGAIEIEKAFESSGQAPEAVQALDVDADGTEELLVHRLAYGADPATEATLHFDVLRWSSGRFASIGPVERDGPWFGLAVGESDGVPGDDIVIGPSQSGDMARATFDGDVMTFEAAHVDLGGPTGGWVAGVAGGAMAIVVEDGALSVRWPRGEAPATVGRLAGLAYPDLFVVGSGPDAIVVAHGNWDILPAGPSTTIYDLELRPLGELAADPDSAAVWEFVRERSQRGYGSFERNMYPHFGPLPGGVAGSPAYLASGMVIQPGGSDGFQARPMPTLVGYQALGLLGPDSHWLAIGDAVPIGSAVYLAPYMDFAFGTGRVALTPLERVMAPAPEASFELRGAVELARTAHELTLVAAAGGFTATISAAEGSVVVVAERARLTSHDLGADPISIEVTPPRNRDGDAPFERDIVVISPEGRATLHRWQGTFVREAPELVATAETDLLSLEATVTGRSSARGATVTVDGAPVELGADGSFSARVEAPPWPRDVAVVVRDALGNEAVSRLQVIGFVDYRGLPWVPILGLATLLAGAALFVRSPGRRPLPAAAGWGDGTLEEIDGD